MQREFWIGQGDTQDPIDIDLPGADLTGASVKLEMSNTRQDASPILSATMTIVDANPGGAGSARVRYDWLSGGTAQAGTFYARVEVTFADTTKKQFPNSGYLLIHVTESVAI